MGSRGFLFYRRSTAREEWEGGRKRKTEKVGGGRLAAFYERFGVLAQVCGRRREREEWVKKEEEE